MHRFALTFVCLAAVSQVAGAASLSFSLDEITTSSGTPGGVAPWLTVDLDDGGTAGSVALTFTATGLVSSEFVSDLYLNLDPALDPAELTFSAGAASGGNGFDLPGIAVGVDAFTGGGSGRYDVRFAFTTSNAGGGTKRFGPGEIYEITIGGIATLTASSFDFLAAPSGGNGVHYALAHIQGITPNASAFVAAPEPSGIVLVGMIVVVAAGWHRRRARA